MATEITEGSLLQTQIEIETPDATPEPQRLRFPISRIREVVECWPDPPTLQCD